MFNNFYNKKNIFITGHTGFKGSWLSIWLKYLNANIKGYSLKPYTKNDIFVASNINKSIESVIADIRDYKKLEKEILSFKPEIIFHLAAQPLVRESYLDPVNTYETNLIGTMNILEVVRKCSSVKVFLNITTDKCYANIENKRGYKEKDKLGGYDPYSSSKACSEIVTSSYYRSFFQDRKKMTGIATVRAGNVIGGGDWRDDRIIPDCIKSLMNNKKIVIRNPNYIRPWQFILEPLSGYLTLANMIFYEPEKYSGAWNFGPNKNNCVKVKDIANLVIKNWGSGVWEYSNKDNLHESRFLFLDCTKAKNKLKWFPLLSISETINLTINWYKEAINNIDMYNYSIKQIGDYSKKAMKKKIKWSIQKK